MKISLETGVDDTNKYMLVIIRIGKFQFIITFDSTCQWVHCSYNKKTLILKKLWNRTPNPEFVKNHILKEIKYQIQKNITKQAYIDTRRASFADVDWYDIATNFKSFDLRETSNELIITAIV